MAVAPLPAGSFQRQWSASLNLPAGQAISHAWLLDQTLLVQTNHNKVYQLGAVSGALEAVLQPAPAGAVMGKPILTKNYLVVPLNADIAIFDHHGRQVNDVPMENAISSGGAVAGERLFIATAYPDSSGRLLALDLSKDYVNTAWELQRQNLIVSTPVVYEGAVYAADKGGSVFAVTADDNRTPLWLGDHVFQTYGPIVADLKVDDYGVYVASSDTTLYCLDRSTAKIKWKWLSGASLQEGPVVTDDTVYQPLPGGQLAAIDKISSDPKAFNRTPRWVVSARQFLAQDASHAYLLGTHGRLLAVDKATGQVEFRSSRSDFAACGVNLTSNTIYAATRSGQVIAIDPVLKAGVVGQME